MTKELNDLKVKISIYMMKKRNAVQCFRMARTSKS
jgi:hypothetical protein